MAIPIIVQSSQRLECNAKFSPSGGSIRLAWGELAGLFNELIGDETLAQLEGQVSSEGFLALRDLKGAGLEADFDQQLLEIAIQIPPRLLRTRSLRMSGQTTMDPHSVKVEPSDVSGYLNVRMLAMNQDGRFRNPSFSLEQVLNVGNWAFEQRGSLDFARGGARDRQYSRIIRDVAAKRVRYTMGELRTPAVSFQDALPLIGLSVARENRLQPFHQPRPKAHSELFIERDSDVEIFVNGDSVRRFHLTPGPYRLEDLQLTAGLTDVEMVVTDRYGVEKRIDLSFSFDHALLATNEKDYYFGYGWKPESGHSDGAYVWSEPLLTGYYRRGYSDVFTGEWNLQAARDEVQVGSEGTWASRIGTFRGAAAVSATRAEGIGHGLGLSYIRYGAQGRGRRHRGQWRVDLRHHSAAFQSIGSVGGNRSMFECQLGHSRQLPWGVGSNFGFGLRRSHTVKDLSFVGRASFSKRFSSSWSSRLNLNVEDGGGRKMQFGVSLRFEWSFGKRQRHRFGTAVDSRSGSRELHYSYQPVNQLRSWRGYGSLQQRQDSGWQGDFQAGYNSPRAEFDLGQSLVQREGELMSTSRFQVGSSLAFAGGRLGISRPINDAFVLVTGHESLRGRSIGINDQGQGEEASLNRWGPAVISDIQSYIPRSVRVNPPDDLPFGYDLGPGQYVAAMPYRSGAAITIGGEPTLFVSGQAIDGEGAPLSLQAGEVFREGDPSWEALSVFTTRNGAFTIEGVRPGDYEIRWFAEDLLPLSFSVSDGGEEFVDLGERVVNVNNEE